MASSSPGIGRQDGAPSGTLVIPAPGAVLFERYRLEALLGQGGMAEVWRAHDEQLDREVAVKLLHRHLLPDERSRQRFAAEARAVAGLSHPGIVTVHDILVDDQQAAMVLELVDGEPLNDVIEREGRISEVGAAAITAQVARALQAAHDRGLVHRDVKPANVLLAADGRARLVDFGIARALDDRDANLTLPGTIMGTLRYMAPEQLSDDAADRATDVFGLGSLLYEMLVGRPPFPAATPAALMAQQRQGAPQILRVSPEELAGLARTALQPDPERRPRSAGLMAALLERWLERNGVSSADLATVTAAALHGGLMPKPAPVIAATPAITPAPIAEPVPAPATAAPEAKSRRTPRRRSASSADAVQQMPLATVAAAGPAAVPGALPFAGTPDPSAVAASVAAAGAATPLGTTSLPGPAAAMAVPAAVVDPTAVTAARTTSFRPWAFGRRRVPLISAIGLAGMLLAILLLAGALTALQAGTDRTVASPTPGHAAPTAHAVAATSSPTAHPAAPVVATPVPAVAPGPPKGPGPGGDKPKPPPKRRNNTN